MQTNSGSCRVNALRGALFPSKSGLMNKHIVEHIVNSRRGVVGVDVDSGHGMRWLPHRKGVP